MGVVESILNIRVLCVTEDALKDERNEGMRFWNNLPVKWKLLVTFLLLVLIPAGIMLVSINNILKKNLEQQQYREGEKVVRLVNNIIGVFEQDLQQTLPLLQQNEALLTTTYLALSYNKNDELLEMVHTMLETLSLDVLEITGFDGEILIRDHVVEELDINITPSPETLDYVSQGNQLLDVRVYKDKILLRALAPLAYQGVDIGCLLIGILVDDSFAQEISEITGDEIAIFIDSASIASSSQAFKKAYQSLSLEQQSTEATSLTMISGVQVNEESYALLTTPFADPQGNTIGTMVVGLAQTALTMIQNQSKSTIKVPETC